MRRAARRTGVGDAEVAAALPGDEVIADPMAVWDRGVTINRPPAAVWPWLAQVGYGRAGYHTPEWMTGRRRQMRYVIEELMTREVVTAGVDATYREVVALMDRHRVSALPVLDADGRPVGIVTSADLILKQDPAVRQSGPPSGARAHVEQVKAAATTAGKLMTTPVLTVRPHQTVAQAVRLLHHFDVKHLPVIDDQDRLVGIVSRGDLLRVFLRPDEEIEREVTEQVLGRPYVAGNVEVAVRVEDGVVRLEGHARRRHDLEALVDLLQEVDGVVAVDSQVSSMSPEPGTVGSAAISGNGPEGTGDGGGRSRVTRVEQVMSSPVPSASVLAWSRWTSKEEA